MFFLVVGDGTDYDVMADYVTTASPDKVRFNAYHVRITIH